MNEDLKEYIGRAMENDPGDCWDFVVGMYSELYDINITQDDSEWVRTENPVEGDLVYIMAPWGSHVAICLDKYTMVHRVDPAGVVIVKSWGWKKLVKGTYRHRSRT